MKMPRLFAKLVLSLILAVSWGSSAYGQKLVFNIDQGYMDHLVYGAGTVAGNRAIANTTIVLQKYRNAGFTETYALINPQNANKDKVVYLLDYLANSNIPFILDAMTPDCLPGHAGTWTDFNGVMYNEPWSRDIGMALELNYPSGVATDRRGIRYYIERYPNHLKGFRVMEPEHIYDRYMRNYNAANPRNENWNPAHVTWHIEKIVATVNSINTARGNSGMWVQFNSSVWENHPTLYPVNADARSEAIWQARRLCAQYPNVIFPSYATNDGNNVNRLRLRSVDGLPLQPWRNLINFPGSRGPGISIQSWMTGAGYFTNTQPPVWNWYNRDNMDVGLLIQFVNDAKRAPWPDVLIQFESPRYFFNTWSSGKATFQNQQIAWALNGIALDDCEQKDREEP